MSQVLDSNIVIYSFLPGHQFLKPFVTNKKNLVSVVTQVESLGFVGIRKKEEDYFNRIFDILQIIPIDKEVLNKTIEIRKRHKIKLGDAFIAATALLYGPELVTRNTKDFKNIPGLTIVDPF